MLLKDINSYLIIKKSGYFNCDFYLSNNPDVRRADINPLMHFVKYGGFEGRNPNTNFDTKLYLEVYQDVKQERINPLVHYIKFGKKEGRIANLKSLTYNGSKEILSTQNSILFVYYDGRMKIESDFGKKLLRTLSNLFNIFTIEIKNGPIPSEIINHSVLVFTRPENNLTIDENLIEFIVKKLVLDQSITLFIINGNIPSGLFPILSKHFIPIIFLINKFPIEGQSYKKLQEAALWSHYTLFTSKELFEQFKEKYPLLVENSFEFLEDHIVQYLNIHDEKTDDSDYLSNEKGRIQNKAETGITTKIKSLESKLQTVIHNEKCDVETIIKSGLFRPDFYPPNFIREIDAIIHYVRSWRTNINRWKLFPGFHPGIYLEQHPGIQDNEDPLAHFIRSNKPNGPWKYHVISDKDLAYQEMNITRIALHIHVYYPDILPEIISRLNKNFIRPDLFLSVPSSVNKNQINKCIKKYTGSTQEIREVPNRGRDIGPFITEFKNEFDDYEIIGHVHTKKSLHLQQDITRKWRNFLLENIIGGTHRMADIILSKMLQESLIGLVYPDDPNIFGWRENLKGAQNLCRRLGINSLPKNITFPAGTMFWARVNAIKPWFLLDLEYNDYPEEPAPLDGSIIHAIERLFPFVSSSAGFENWVTNVEDISR